MIDPIQALRMTPKKMLPGFFDPILAPAGRSNHAREKAPTPAGSCYTERLGRQAQLKGHLWRPFLFARASFVP